MSKIRIDVDQLKVESFETTGGDSPEPRGTVRGYNRPATKPTNGPGESDPDFGCGTGKNGCDTMYNWSGCDISCVIAPCRTLQLC